MICPNCRAANADTAKYCATCGAPLSALQAPEGERKLVSVLFADVAGSTAIAEQVDPEEVAEIMNGAFDFMNAAVAGQRGMVARLMGDAILAFFGVPVAYENDAERAIRAGLELQKSAVEYAGQVRQRYGLEFRVRVGINTGLAVMDIIGSQVRSEFTAMGDTVNVASRLQNAASPGEVLISHDTYRHVRGLFAVQSLEPIYVRGKSEPLQAYRVTGTRARPFRQPARGVSGIETPIVGREAELRQLQANLSVLEGPGPVKARIVTIVGEAGMGKSRLLYEFTRWLELQPKGQRILRARATEEMDHLPYSLLRVLLTAEFEIIDSDSEAVAKGKLERGIAKHSGPEHADWAPFIGHILGFDYTSSPQLQGILEDAHQIHERAFYHAAQFFKTVLRDQPVLILLEDIHWADEGSLDFFEHLVQDCLDLPLMIVVLARNALFERRPSWGGGQAIQIRVDLAPLSESDSQKLVGEILRHIPEIPPSLQHLIVSRAEGNPFYVEEVIKMLIDDGVIVPGPERWQFMEERLVEWKIPPTLTGVLQARLDGLPVQERKVLHCASVAGRVFWDELAARMSDAGDYVGVETLPETSGVLASLSDREMIFRRDPSAFAGTTEYIFKHALLRDVAYERLLKRLRRAYHLKVAEWLCERSGERAGEYAGRIGEHFELAGEPARAADWYARAGQQAQETYAPEIARDYYQQALSLWAQAGDLAEERRSQQIEAYHGLGQVLNWLGRYGEAVEAFQNMAGAADAHADTAAQARAWHGIAEAQMHRGDTREAIESASKEEELARASGTQLDLTRALWMKAWGAFKLGEIETALSLARRVAQLSSRSGDRGQIAHSLNLLGVLESVTGHFQEASHYFEQALEIFLAIGNRRRAMPLMNNLGVIMESRGYYEQAMARYLEALDTARQIGNRDGEMIYLSNLGGVKVRLGEYAAAEADLRQVIHMAALGGLDVLSSTYCCLAEACLGLGNATHALACAQRALALAESRESQEDLGVAWRALAKVAAYLGEAIPVAVPEQGQPRIAIAEGCYAESARILAQIKREEERARTLREWAKYLLEQGEQERAQRMWQEAREIFVQLGAQPEVERMEEFHAQQIDRLGASVDRTGPGHNAGSRGLGG